MKDLWKQRDNLIKENTDYEIKNQLLDEELRLIKRYKDSLEKQEDKLKVEVSEANKQIKAKDEIIDIQEKKIR